MVEELQRIWSTVDLGGTRVFSFETARIFPLLKKVALKAPRILEVGAGDGRMIRLLQAEGVLGKFYANDITERVYQTSALAVVADARALPFVDRAFDLVYSLGVVEHFPQTADAIAEHARVSTSGGFVFVTTPHLGLETLVRWIYGYLGTKSFQKGSFEAVQGRNLSLQYMRMVVSQTGLSILECAATGAVLYLSLPDFIKRLLQRLLPEDKFGSYLYVLARKP